MIQPEWNGQLTAKSPAAGQFSKYPLAVFTITQSISFNNNTQLISWSNTHTLSNRQQTVRVPPAATPTGQASISPDYDTPFEESSGCCMQCQSPALSSIWPNSLTHLGSLPLRSPGSHNSLAPCTQHARHITHICYRKQQQLQSPGIIRQRPGTWWQLPHCSTSATRERAVSGEARSHSCCNHMIIHIYTDN